MASGSWTRPFGIRTRPSNPASAWSRSPARVVVNVTLSSDVVQGAPICVREPKLDLTGRCSNPPSSDFDLDAFLTDARVTYD